MRTHIESFKREINESVNFLSTTEAISIPRRLKPLETDNHDLRYTIYLEGLSRLDMLRALITIPFVVCVKNL